MDFRKIIKEAADARGWSAYRLGQEAGMPIRTVQAYFASERDLSGGRLARLCKALDLGLRPIRRKGGQ